MQRAPASDAHRLAAGLSMLATAGLFLWCWLDPLAWQRTLVADLAVVVLLELFVLGTASGLIEEQDTRAGAGFKERERAQMKSAAQVPVMLVLMAATLLYAGSWVTFAAFVLAIYGRYALIRASNTIGESHRQHQLALWRISWSVLALLVIVAMVYPGPRLGITLPGAEYGIRIPGLLRKGLGFLERDPQLPIAVGFCYFALIGFMTLLSRPAPDRQIPRS